jgi:hypothetical protein
MTGPHHTVCPGVHGEGPAGKRLEKSAYVWCATRLRLSSRGHSGQRRAMPWANLSARAWLSGSSTVW